MEKSSKDNACKSDMDKKGFKVGFSAHRENELKSSNSLEFEVEMVVLRI